MRFAFKDFVKINLANIFENIFPLTVFEALKKKYNSNTPILNLKKMCPFVNQALKRALDVHQSTYETLRNSASELKVSGADTLSNLEQRLSQLNQRWDVVAQRVQVCIHSNKNFIIQAVSYCK